MPRLPESDAIERHTPRDAYEVQSYRGGIAEGAQAEAATEMVRAVGKFTEGVQKIGTEILDARDKSELANANSALLRAKADADTAFADDPDYGTWAARYQQQLGQAQQTIAGGISSDRVRAAFSDQAALNITEGATALVEKSQGRAMDQRRSQLTDLIAANREAALNASDPVTREGLLNATVESIAAARDGGLITDQEARDRGKRFVTGYEVDRADRFATSLESEWANAGGTLIADPSKVGALQAEFAERIEASGLHEDQKAKLREVAKGRLVASALQGHIAADPVRAKADLEGGAWDGYLDAGKKDAALNAVDVQIARDANRAERQRRQASRDAEDKIIQQISADDKSLSVMGVEQNQALSPAKKSEMIGVLRRSTQPDPPAAISRDTMIGLAKRVHADDADPLKVRDSSALNEAYAAGSLTGTDFYRLRQEFADAQTPDGAALGRRKANFLNGIEPLIDKTDPWSGVVDETGKQQFYEFMATVDRAVERYKKEEKDPYDLFDPSKSDYLGKPGLLASFRRVPDIPRPDDRLPLDFIFRTVTEMSAGDLVNAIEWARTAGYSDQKILDHIKGALGSRRGIESAPLDVPPGSPPEDHTQTREFDGGTWDRMKTKPPLQNPDPLFERTTLAGRRAKPLPKAR